MLATLVDAPFDDKDWVFETKWDGFRLVAKTGRGHVSLYSRNGNEVTARYSAVWAGYALAYLVHDFEGGAALINRALLLNPNLATGRTCDGWIKVWLGEPEPAIQHLAHAMRLTRSIHPWPPSKGQLPSLISSPGTMTRRHRWLNGRRANCQIFCFRWSRLPRATRLLETCKKRTRRWNIYAICIRRCAFPISRD